MGQAWSEREIQLIITDYFAMLKAELSHQPYNKTEYRKRLQQQLSQRTEQAIEFKHCNISAVLLDQLGTPYIPGYKPRRNYQKILLKAIATRLSEIQPFVAQAETNTIEIPSVDDILSILTPTRPPLSNEQIREPLFPYTPADTPKINYLERDARNQMLGLAGEQFILNYERARLIAARQEPLADKIVHTAAHNDGAGYDILSYDSSGRERLIEVKTTKYGAEVPFFLTPNEVRTSETRETSYHLYRLYSFRKNPKLFTVPGALSTICHLEPNMYKASIR